MKSEFFKVFLHLILSVCNIYDNILSKMSQIFSINELAKNDHQKFSYILKLS